MTRTGEGWVEALKRINTPPPPEDSRALRLSVMIAVWAAAAGVVGQGIGDRRLGLLVLAGIPVGSFTSYRLRHRPGYRRKAALAVVATVAFVQFLTTAASGSNSNELRVPLAELFLWIQLLHSFDLPSRRDLLFSLLSSLALVLVGGVLSISPGFGVLLAIWGAAALVSLVLAQRSQLNELPPLSAAAPLSRRAAVGLVFGTVALVGMVTAVTFVLIPDAGSPEQVSARAHLAGGAGVPDPSTIYNPTIGRTRASFGYFGFSSSLDLAARGRPDGTPVMRVRASRPDFWRGQTFDTWDGRRWSIADERAVPVGGRFPLEIEPAPEEKLVQYLGRPFVQTFYLQRPGPNLLFGAYKPDQVFAPVPSLLTLPDGTMRTTVQMGPGTVYTVVSRRPPVTETLLRDTSTRVSVSADFMGRNTQLPPGVTPRVRALAAEVTAGAPTAYDKVRALEAWMGANTTYTLDIPSLPPGADAVDHFLFVDRRGFCEQIGSALVVMLRSLGIPARLAVGFAPGEREPFTGLWQVRARDAHAWAEVFFPNVGWQAFDPTASVPLSGEAERPSRSTSLLSWLGDRLPGVPDRAPEAAGGLAVAGLGVAGVVVVGRRRRRARQRPWAVGWMRSLERAGSRRGRARRPTETPREYADALVGAGVASNDLATAVALVEAEMFSGEPATEEERQRAETLLARAGPAAPR
ncbi:MAG: transglutaminase TgpA family protein [Acidimicrobiales bacterium]